MLLNNRKRVHHIPKTLGHFLASLEPMAMDYDTLRRRKTERVEIAWPINTVKSSDILAYQMDHFKGL